MVSVAAYFFAVNSKALLFRFLHGHGRFQIVNSLAAFFITFPQFFQVEKLLSACRQFVALFKVAVQACEIHSAVLENLPQIR